MPEGPETARSVDALKALFVGGMDSYHLIGFARFGKRFPHATADQMRPAIDGRLQRLYAIGKFYFFEFEGAWIVAHQGLKGKWTLEQEKNSQFRFDFARLDAEGFIDEASEFSFYFTNQLNGKFDIYNDRAKFEEVRDSIAPGFLGDYLLTKDDWLKRLKRFKTKRVRDILFDQHELVSGLGNYLIAEIMYRLEIHPNAGIHDLDDDLRARMYDVAKELVIGFYEGTERKLVYKQKFTPEGYEVTNITIAGRAAHYCPSIQTIGSK